MRLFLIDEIDIVIRVSKLVSPLQLRRLERGQTLVSTIVHS